MHEIIMWLGIKNVIRANHKFNNRPQMFWLLQGKCLMMNRVWKFYLSTDHERPFFTKCFSLVTASSCTTWHSRSTVVPSYKVILRKATSLIMSDFRCSEIVKYYLIVPPLKRGHPSYKAICFVFFFYCRRNGFIRRGLLYKHTFMFHPKGQLFLDLSGSTR